MEDQQEILRAAPEPPGGTDGPAAEQTPSEASPGSAAPEEPTPPGAEAAPPEPESDGAGRQVLESLAALAEKLDGLAARFDERIRRTAYEEKIVDQMHGELQRYKEDLYAQLVRPILTDIVETRDSILRVAANYTARPEGGRDVPHKTFAGYAFDLQDILEKNGVDIYRSGAGDGFTPLRQRAIRKVKTDDPSLHGKVAESLSCGYAYNGRILSAEKVSVYFYEAPADRAAENKEEK